MREFQFYFVSTPIGNLGDFSERAVHVIRSSDLLLAEDTRKTKTLLARYAIDIPVRSFHDFNKERTAPAIIDQLKDGKRITLVSDAGTPAISDPGYYLVRLLIEEGISFTSVPGPSAVTNALLLSGFPPDRFAFFGYLPKKKGAFEKVIAEAMAFSGTSIFFESPYRINKSLELLSKICGDREVAVAREMTKLHEEVIRGRPEDLIRMIGERKIRGEITLLLRGTGSRRGVKTGE